MRVENYKSPVPITITTFTGTLKLGSFRGLTLGAQLTGLGTTDGSSDWKLVQSNDGTNWIDIVGGTFTDIANETLSIDLSNVYTMLYIGLQRVSAGGETTGTVSLNATFKH